MCMNIGSVKEIMANGGRMEIASDCTYLRSTVSSEDGVLKDVSVRITKVPIV